MAEWSKVASAKGTYKLSTHSMQYVFDHSVFDYAIFDGFARVDRNVSKCTAFRKLSQNKK